VRRVFFNGNGLWIEGRADEWFTPKTRAEIARLHRVLHEHRDAFTSSHPVALVPTLRAGVLVNEFPADDGNKSVYTIFNSNYGSVGGEILSVPHSDETVYLDAFAQKTLQPTIAGRHAILTMDMKPRDVACIVVKKR
jgi:hypothetical protein